jgi:hypothetical protein
MFTEKEKKFWLLRKNDNIPISIYFLNCIS